MYFRIALIGFLLLSITAMTLVGAAGFMVIPSNAQSQVATIPPTSTPRNAIIAAPTAGATLTATPYPPDPQGCLRPPDDYTRVMVNGQQLSQRTLAMLAHAQTLYTGPIQLTSAAVTQGSYNAGGVALSFGTHDEGGAVDISVRNIPGDWSIRWEDIPLLITALRTAGFAAWYRDEDNEMTPHIHAIAIGDAELSRAASLQLIGRYGYFRGFDGLPQDNGVPFPDENGELILCNWMREMGYDDWREETVVNTPPYTFVPGDTAYINMTWGEELNMRSAPSLQGTIIAKLQPETQVTILGGPTEADGYRWWQFTLEDGTSGWAVETLQEINTLVK